MAIEHSSIGMDTILCRSSILYSPARFPFFWFLSCSFAICAEPEHTGTTPFSGSITGRTWRRLRAQRRASVLAQSLDSPDASCGFECLSQHQFNENSSHRSLLHYIELSPLLTIYSSPIFGTGIEWIQRVASFKVTTGSHRTARK